MSVKYKRKSNINIPESEADKYIYRSGTRKPIGVARDYKHLSKVFPWNFLVVAAKYSENINLDGITMSCDMLSAMSGIMLDLYSFKTIQSRTAFYLRFIEKRTISDIQAVMGVSIERVRGLYSSEAIRLVRAGWLMFVSKSVNIERLKAATTWAEMLSIVSPYDITLNSLCLPARAHNTLARSGVEVLSDIILCDGMFSMVRNMGINTFKQMNNVCRNFIGYNLAYENPAKCEEYMQKSGKSYLILNNKVRLLLSNLK